MSRMRNVGWCVALGFAMAAIQPLATDGAAQTVVDLRAQSPRGRIAISGKCEPVGARLQGAPYGRNSINGALPGADGAFFLMNIGISNLMRIDASGRGSTVMGAGEGRGALSANTVDSRRLRVEPYRNDSIAVYDAMRRVATILAPDGSFARDISVELGVDQGPVPKVFMVAASLPDGDLIFTRSTVEGPMPAGGGLVADTVSIMRVSADGKPVWMSPPLEGLAREIFVMQGNLITSAQMIYRRGFVRTRSTVTVGNRVFHYAESRHEIDAYDRSGTLVARILLPPVFDPSSTPGAPQRQALSLLADGAGRIWFEIPRSKQSQKKQWWVIAADGSMFASAETPLQEEVLFVNSRAMIVKRIDTEYMQNISVCEVRQ
jgi:hypothetical protein